MSDFDAQENQNEEPVEGLSGFQKTAAIWGVVSFVFTVFAINISAADYPANNGVFALFFGGLLGTVLGLAGALLGDGLRRFAMPQAYFTSGGMSSLIKIKLFWMCGPQVVGMLIGSIIGLGLILG